MGDFDECRTCGRWAWLDKHVCGPAWECDTYDDLSNARTVYASDSEGAAERYCDEHDPENDYTIISNGGGVVYVRPVGGGEISIFDIEAESRPHYSASERT